MIISMNLKENFTLFSSIININTRIHKSTPSNSSGKWRGKSTSENRVWSGRANNIGDSFGSVWIWLRRRKENRDKKKTYSKEFFCLL